MQDLYKIYRKVVKGCPLSCSIPHNDPLIIFYKQPVQRKRAVWITDFLKYSTIDKQLFQKKQLESVAIHIANASEFMKYI